jgi:hypothetical protein
LWLKVFDQKSFISRLNLGSKKQLIWLAFQNRIKAKIMAISILAILCQLNQLFWRSNPQFPLGARNFYWQATRSTNFRGKKIRPSGDLRHDPQLEKAGALPTELTGNLGALEIAILLKIGKIRWGSV